MKNILVLGAGKSATALISYLIEEAKTMDCHITIADRDPESARKKAGNAPLASAASFNIKDTEARRSFINRSDLVISLLPPALHLAVAKDCILLRKHLLTASYLSPEMQKLKDDTEKAGILIMGEMGLDPGIDHMSAMKALHQIREKGGVVTAFESFCGALTAPESDDNPWHYKISWSPRSLVTAGNEGGKYRRNGKIQTIPYASLFGSYKIIEIPESGKMAYYPNRDSERYAQLYRLNEVPTVMRATLRHPDFCKGWQAIVTLGLTDTSQKLETGRLSYKEWIDTAIRQSGTNEKINKELQDPQSLLHRQFRFLGLLDDRLIGKGIRTAGDVLLERLSEKLFLKPEDKDLVVMFHRVTFKESGHAQTFNSLLKIQGTDNRHTAIAKTVGLPLGILARFLLTGKIKLTGLHIPIVPEVYLPVLEALETEGIQFTEYIR